MVVSQTLPPAQSGAESPLPQSTAKSEGTTATSHDLTSHETLPDSPGIVLRRAKEASTLPGQDGELKARPSDEALSTDDAWLIGVAERQEATPGASLTAAQARASDTSRRSNCANAPGPGIARSNPDTGHPTSRKVMKPETATGEAVPNSVPPGDASTQTLACPAPNPYRRFLNSTTPIPLTPRQKGYLAIRNFIDPGNVVTVLGSSGIAIASDSHSAYGPGWRGFGKNAGVSFVQDATGDFFGTFLIPAITHEDPHYHRRPDATMPVRVLHAISRTVIAQSDGGRAIPNYATVGTYPITAEIANLYVPGIASSGSATARRVMLGYATDPIDNLITEFLPDVAKRIHVRVIFVQQIINQVAAGQPVSMFQ